MTNLITVFTQTVTKRWSVGSRRTFNGMQDSFGETRDTSGRIFACKNAKFEFFPPSQSHHFPNVGQLQVYLAVGRMFDIHLTAFSFSVLKMRCWGNGKVWIDVVIYASFLSAVASYKILINLRFGFVEFFFSFYFNLIGPLSLHYSQISEN